MDKNNIEKFQDLHDLKHSAWLNRPAYEEAEYVYQERLAKESLTPLAGEVAKARQRLIESRDTFKEATTTNINTSVDPDTLKFLEKNIVEFDKAIKSILSKLNALDIRVSSIEKGVSSSKPAPAPPKVAAPQKDEEEDDGVDLFGSDSEAEDEAVTKLKEERLAAYNAKKSKKPALIAKSSILLDVKPWDDETDMKELEAGVRKIQMDGLIWGVSKLVPLAYGIHKLQITCVVEDEKVSIDTLTELIESNEDFVQSVDIFAFNKI